MSLAIKVASNRMRRNILRSIALAISWLYGSTSLRFISKSATVFHVVYIPEKFSDLNILPCVEKLIGLRAVAVVHVWV